MQQAPEVFISYRSDDTGDVASRLYDALEGHFGHGTVFLDQERLAGGTVWPAALRTAVAGARVVLALIGPHWLTVQDPASGDRRLNVAEDWVRLELEGALAAGRVIVPVLVGGARHLEPVDLRTVPSLQPLASLQPMRLRREDWRDDIERLTARLAALGVPVTERPRLSARWLKVAGAAAVLVLLAVGAATFWSRNRSGPAAPGDTAPPSTPSPSPPTTVDVTLNGAVQVPALWVEKYAEEYANYRIEARAGRPKTTLADAPLDAEGAFRLTLAVPPDTAQAPELAWTWTTAGRWVLWPVVQEHATSPFDGYTFMRLDDTFYAQKGAILRDISRGEFEGANSELLELSSLFEMFGDPGQAAIPGYAVGELTFKLLQEMCTKAHDYRSALGRSRVSDDIIGVEREWRKRQFAAARNVAAPTMSLTRALNAWGDFSREVYSRDQRRWPDRDLVGASDDAFVEPRLSTMLVEDLSAVIGELRWLKDASQARGTWTRLDAGYQRTYEQIIESDPDAVSLSRLADLLTTLVAARL